MSSIQRTHAAIKALTARLLPKFEARETPAAPTTFISKGGITMKTQYFWIIGIGLILLGSAFAFFQEDIDQHGSCIHCGMDRQIFAHSRMLIEYDDGSTVGLCSLHCAAVELEAKSVKAPKKILVADYNSKVLIDAKKAFWVLGGSKKGVMTKTAKWAFERKEKAEGFIRVNGGELINFDQAMKAAQAELSAKKE